MANLRVQAVEAYVKALRTGESSAAVSAAGHLATDIVVVSGKDEFVGSRAALQRITGQWPNTPVYLQGAWSSPQESDGQIIVSSVFTGLGAAPAGLRLTFSFDAAERISRVEQEIIPAAPAAPAEVIPDFVKGLVNNALANGTPMVVAYTDEQGQPVLSLRGSTQVYSPTQLCAWLRNADGGLITGLQKNPRMSLLYRDSKTRTTLNFQGRGHIETDEEVRGRVYELAPEVEQNHDPAHKGAALLIDVERLFGLTPNGGGRLVRGGA